MTVRVRYAPSPTGLQHVGGVRTALFNYLFALHNNGEFNIRIEDTDQKRYNNDAVTDLINTLNWLGIKWHDGPTTQELIDLGVDEELANQNGRNTEQSYVQSKRNGLYYDMAHKLIDNGKAYPVFSDDSIEEESEDKKQARRELNVYRWRSASPFMIRKTMATGQPYHIRLKMPREDDYMVCNDYLRGDIKFHYRKLYDPVILKTPNPEQHIPAIPSYHLAHVVDDHLMQTTHVLRGEEWLSSLPFHVYLWQCFGWDIPTYCHLPVILNPTGKGKMSKRETRSGTGEIVPVFAHQYKSNGYLPQAMINFMSLIGWNPGKNQDIFSFWDIVDLFGLDRINKTGAMWDIRKLKSMNQYYIRMMDCDTFAREAEVFI